VSIAYRPQCLWEWLVIISRERTNIEEEEGLSLQDSPPRGNERVWGGEGMRTGVWKGAGIEKGVRVWSLKAAENAPNFNGGAREKGHSGK